VRTIRTITTELHLMGWRVEIVSMRAVGSFTPLETEGGGGRPATGVESLSVEWRFPRCDPQSQKNHPSFSKKRPLQKKYGGKTSPFDSIGGVPASPGRRPKVYRRVGGSSFQFLEGVQEGGATAVGMSINDIRQIA